MATPEELKAQDRPLSRKQIPRDVYQQFQETFARDYCSRFVRNPAILSENCAVTVAKEKSERAKVLLKRNSKAPGDALKFWALLEDHWPTKWKFLVDTLDAWIKKPSQMPKDAGSHEPLFTVTQVKNALAIQRSRSKKRRKRQQKRRLAGKRSAAAAKKRKTEEAHAKETQSSSSETASTKPSEVLEFSLRTDLENASSPSNDASGSPASAASAVVKTSASLSASRRPARTDDDLPSEDEFEVDSDVSALDDSDDDI